MQRTDKNSQPSSMIWPGWLNGWVFLYELNGCGFEFVAVTQSDDCLNFGIERNLGNVNAAYRL